MSRLRVVLWWLRTRLFAGLCPRLLLIEPAGYQAALEAAGFNSRLPLLRALFSPASQASTVSACPLFDPDYFAQSAVAEGFNTGSDPLRDYLRRPELWQLPPHPLFDPDHYVAQLEAPSKRAPLLDYLLRGDQAPDPHPLFSQSWYLGRNPHIRHALGFSGASALTHFLVEGARRGELPNPYFHTIWYANKHLGGDRISGNPLQHWVSRGFRQGLSPSPLFDAPAYREAHRLSDGDDPLGHYLGRHPLVFPRDRNRLTDMFWPRVGDSGGAPEKGGVPGRKLLILFTPRSGSTWLTGLLTRTGVLGHPTEWFNHRMIARHCAAMDCYPASLAEYVDAVTRLRAGDNGWFSAELSCEDVAHLQAAGGLEALLPDAQYLFLYRRDIVAQAVSLFLASRSAYFHQRGRANEVHQPAYDARRIRYWIEQLLSQEAGLRRFLEVRAPAARWLSYEDLRESPETAVADILQPLGLSSRVPLVALREGEEQRISNSRNSEYAARFRAAHRRYLARLEGRRGLAAR